MPFSVETILFIIVVVMEMDMKENSDNQKTVTFVAFPELAGLIEV